MAESSFWKRFRGRGYFSYFIVFCANITCWFGTTVVLGYFTAPEPPTYHIFTYLIVSIFSSILFGKLVDRNLNRRAIITIGILLTFIGFLMAFLLISTNLQLIDRSTDAFLISILLGIAFSASTVSIGAHFADVTAPKERGKLQGISYCVAFAISFIIFIFTSILELVFILLIILVAALGVFNILYVPLTESKAAPEASSYLEVLTNKNFIYYVLSFFLFMIALPFINLFFEYGTIALAYQPIYISIYYPMLSGVALLGGLWADRGRRTMILLSFLMLGVGFAIWGIIPEEYATLLITLVFIWILFSFVNGITNITDYIIPADHATPFSRGRYVVIFFIATNIGWVISTVLQPFVITFSSTTIALIVTFFLLLAITPTILTTDSLEEALAKEVDVKGIYVISQDGRTMAEMSFKDVLIDVDLITSALSAVGDLIKESIHSEKRLKTIDHGDVKILIEYGGYVNSAIITDKETKDLRARLKEFLYLFETNYREYIDHWSGDVRPFFEAYKLMEKYFGIYLAKSRIKKK
ncbi:MAG: MFS transporter [Candidatus Helarchaeota archaeon]